METHHLLTIKGRLEHQLRAADDLVVHGDDGHVRKLELLLLAGEVVDLLLEVHGDVAELLLDLHGGHALGRGVQVDLGLGEDLADVVGQVTASKVDTLDGVGHGVALVDGDSVGHTVTAIDYDTGGTAGSVEGEDSLDGDVEATSVEGLEHDLGHALTVLAGVHWGLGEKHASDVLVILGLAANHHAELVVESVSPDLLHVLPVGDHTMLEGELEHEDTTLLLGLLADVVLLVSPGHHGLVLGVADA